MKWKVSRKKEKIMYQRGSACIINVKERLENLGQRKGLAFFLVIISVLFLLFNLPSIAYLTLTVSFVLLLSKPMIYAIKYMSKTIINVVVSLITLFLFFFMLMLAVVYFFT